jgi:hypothetical protein
MILKLKEVALLSFLRLCMIWVILALTFQVTMLTLSFVNPKLETKIGNEIMWKIDGRFNK